MALLYFQPQFFYHPFQEYNFWSDGTEACWGLNKLWILWSLYDQREEHTYRLETDWLFCYILIKEPFDFPILVLYSTTSSCFFIPFKSFFFKKQSAFFPMLQRVLDGKLKQAISNCSFSPIISMDVPLLLTNKVHKKEGRLYFFRKKSYLLIISILYH